VDDTIIAEWLIGMNVAGIGRGPTDVISPHIPGGTEEYIERTEIRTRHLPRTSIGRYLNGLELLRPVKIRHVLSCGSDVWHRMNGNYLLIDNFCYK